MTRECQRSPKMAPGWPQMAPRCPQDGPRCPKREVQTTALAHPNGRSRRKIQSTLPTHRARMRVHKTNKRKLWENPSLYFRNIVKSARSQAKRHTYAFPWFLDLSDDPVFEGCLAREPRFPGSGRWIWALPRPPPHHPARLFPGQTPHVCISLVPKPLGRPGF